MGDKPFFMYFAPGACHAPHHVPKEWANKYKGRFDQGWDKLREEIFARQKKLGVIPANAELTERPAEIPAWDEMPDGLKPILARQMDIYAAFLEHTDHHVGRLVDALKDLEVLDDTLIYYIIGYPRFSGREFERGLQRNVYAERGADWEWKLSSFWKSKIDDFGGPDAYNHYAVGWAHAMDTPYQWTKQVASHWGGTRNGTIGALAEWCQSQGRDPLTVLSCHRCRPDDPGSGRSVAADDCQQRATGPHGGLQHALCVRRRQGGRATRDPVF